MHSDSSVANLCLLDSEDKLIQFYKINLYYWGQDLRIGNLLSGNVLDIPIANETLGFIFKFWL